MDQNKELMKHDFSEKQQPDNGNFSLVNKILAFIQLVRKRNYRFWAIFALSGNPNLSCFKQMFECVPLPDSFCCFVLLSVSFWCLMSNKCSQHKLLFEGTEQCHHFMFPWNIRITKFCFRISVSDCNQWSIWDISF